MKALIILILLLPVSVGYTQTLTDIAGVQNITLTQHSPMHFGNGMSFYDFDEDGWDDLTFPVHNDSVAFFRNVNGNFVQIGSMLYSPGNMRQISWVDYDNDGDLDLCTTFDDIGLRLYQNDGFFNFSDVTAAAGISTAAFKAYGFSFADPDTDGDLDFYVCSYETTGYVPNPTPNRYYENNGNGTFTDMATAYGIDNGLQTSFMPVWFDYNNDNQIDLHVINDRNPFNDAFYENQGGGLSYNELGDSLGVSNNGHNPMSVSVSDFNNDGFQDIFKSDIANGMVVQGVPINYKLYRNQSGVEFEEVAASMNVGMDLYAWGALWIDYDNDCFEDLYIATSYIDTINDPDAHSLFYKNVSGNTFTLNNGVITGDIICSSYCPVKGDINNDGFYDIVVLNDGVAPNVLLNSGNNGFNYIKITPVGTISNRLAIGAVIKVYANNTCQTQTVFNASDLTAQSSQHKIFGTKTSSIVDSVIITFPSGIVMKEYNLQVNQDYEIREKITIYVDMIPGSDTLIGCYDDTLTIGQAGYINYQWSTGATTPYITAQNTGIYSFIAESMTGDTIYKSLPEFIYIEPQVVYQEVITDPPCGPGSTGSVEIVPGQPQLVDSINWSNGFQGTLNSSLLPGTYSYTIYTVSGCEYQGSAMLVETPVFDVQFFTSPATDNGGGSVQIFIWGGTEPFTYVMDTTTVSEHITDLLPGTYEVVITDVNGCQETIQFTIEDEMSVGLEEANTNFSTYASNGVAYVCSDISMDDAEVFIFDMTGKQLAGSDSWDNSGENCLQHPYDLPEGLYQVRILYKDQTVTKALFIR